MRITLRQACTVLICLLSVSAWAQSYPSRPITFIVPFSAGTGIDLIARGLGAKLAERWKIGVVIDNRNAGNSHHARYQMRGPLKPWSLRTANR